MPELDHVDIAIIGGGVIGLAIAWKITTHPRLKNASMVLLERHHDCGQETSSRNSEVIHAGIYYPQDSLKATLCVEGRLQLYDYCRRFAIPHRQTGKLIIAGEGQEQSLAAIANQAMGNGVLDLEETSPQAIRAMEPAVVAAGGLFSPSSGIIDSHAYMQSLKAKAEAGGLVFSPLTCVTLIARHPRGFLVETRCQETSYLFTCEKLVNSAGLSAQQVAAAIDGFPAAAIPALAMVKGSYFSLQGKSPFSRLIYPVPERDLQGLGVHVTLDLAGQARFGPDTEPVSEVDYAVDVAKENRFREAISRYYPAIGQRKILPAYSGIRPKLAVNSGIADFVIQRGAGYGFDGLVQLFGIESPGLTASLAIADTVSGFLSE